MSKTLHIHRLLRETGLDTFGEEVFDLSGEDYLDYSVNEPVSLQWKAEIMGEYVRLHLYLVATLHTTCVRCLCDFNEELIVERTYDISAENLQGDFPEYPRAKDGGLDLAELAYGEIVMDAPIQAVCDKDNCLLACSVCGGISGYCMCEKDSTTESAGVTEQEQDPRWQALRDLLPKEE